MTEAVLDLRLFQYALASAEQGSFRRAAAVLDVQQSTVSRGVRSLEHRVGAALFERSHAGIRPTRAGDRFLEEAALGLDHLTRATRRLGALQRGELGELTVGASVPLVLLSDLLSRFRKECAGVSVEFVEATSSASLVAVQQRRMDVAFVAKTHGLGAPSSTPLRDERMIVVLPNSHRLAGARAVRLEELRAERLILSAGGLGPDIEDHLARRISRTGDKPHIQMQRVGQSNLINMVALGFGVTIVVGPHSCPEAVGVALVPLAAKSVVTLQAIWMESNPNPALKSLLNIVRKSGRPGPAP